MLAYFLPKNLENVQQNLQHREYRFLVDLDSGSKVGKSTSPPPPSPHWTQGNLNFELGDTRDHFEPLPRAPRFKLDIH